MHHKNLRQKIFVLDEKHVGDLEQLPFEDNYFDAVVSLWVLEHLERSRKSF
jgi:ubiquinone/menaquinone biosynthesis C-methylase UbiE